MQVFRAAIGVRNTKSIAVNKKTLELTQRARRSDKRQQIHTRQNHGERDVIAWSRGHGFSRSAARGSVLR